MTQLTVHSKLTVPVVHTRSTFDIYVQVNGRLDADYVLVFSRVEGLCMAGMWFRVKTGRCRTS